ncbi:MAG: hypothetical protein K2Y23_23845 [Cyanobacteria bacterium]|nr:hypothetical protein [Cyanobacteriota bacterium]
MAKREDDEELWPLAIALAVVAATASVLSVTGLGSAMAIIVPIVFGLLAYVVTTVVVSVNRKQ